MEKQLDQGRADLLQRWIFSRSPFSWSEVLILMDVFKKGGKEIISIERLLEKPNSCYRPFSFNEKFLSFS